MRAEGVAVLGRKHGGYLAAAAASEDVGSMRAMEMGMGVGDSQVDGLE